MLRTRTPRDWRSARSPRSWLRVVLFGWLSSLSITLVGQTATERALILPEQRSFYVRSPEQFRPASLPPVPEPPTVSKPLPERATLDVSLNEAVRIALENSAVVRILAGNTAVSTGSTIYDPGINNTQIDAQRGRFDPTLQNRSTWSQQELPTGQFNLAPPPTTIIRDSRNEGFNNQTTVSKQFLTGATAAAGVNVNRNDFRNGLPQPLNPQTSVSPEVSLTQPLLQGFGYRANNAPILIARINTERSFFQLKGSVQELVRSVIESYRNLQLAQIQIWAAEQQVNQTREVYERAEARLKSGFGTDGEAAQAKVSYENFRANLVAAQANLWQQEGILRNLLGIAPADGRRILPASPFSKERLPTDWTTIHQLAEVNRPDLIELKLILEADEQQLLLQRNQAQPQLDAVALYRWNGLEGRTPDSTVLRADSADYQEWQTGVNFSVPLGLRTGRANVRQVELLLTRDRANLDQGLHQTNHELAATYRELASTYEQYLAYKRVREAAYTNIEQQLAAFQANTKVLFLNVLLAINDWGNSVNNESRALAQYNIALAKLEAQTGTILETYGVRFAEERYGSVGPKGKHFVPVCYPAAMSPTPNWNRPEPTAEQSYRIPEFVPLPNVDAPPKPAVEVLPKP
jgi:outer membrane protein TolC